MLYFFQMKNKKIGIIIAVLLILISSGLFLFNSRKNRPPANVAPPPGNSLPAKSLKDLLMMNKAQQCNLSRKDKDTSYTVTIYMDNSQVRGNIATVNSGQLVNSHMIMLANETYIWTEGQNNGIKMTLNSTAPVTTPIPGQSGGVNLDEKAEYRCLPWIADQKVFNLPTGIQFSDFSKMAVPSGVTDTTDKCAACNPLSGDAKTQCLSALGCN